MFLLVPAYPGCPGPNDVKQWSSQHLEVGGTGHRGSGEKLDCSACLFAELSIVTDRANKETETLCLVQSLDIIIHHSVWPR